MRKFAARLDFSKKKVVMPSKKYPLTIRLGAWYILHVMPLGHDDLRW